jgi:hypothetical protein
MNTVLCATCEKAMEATALFCSGCGTPNAFSQNAPTSKTKRSNLKIVAAMIVLPALLAGGASYLLLKPQRSTGTAIAQSHTAADVQSPSLAQDDKADAARLSAFNGAMKVLNDRKTAIEVNYATAMSNGTEINGTCSQAACYQFTEKFQADETQVDHEIDQLQMPALNNQAALKHAREALGYLRESARLQQDKAAIITTIVVHYVDGSIDRPQLLNKISQLRDQQQVAEAAFQTAIFASYAEYGIRPADIDLNTATLKTQADQR